MREISKTKLGSLVEALIDSDLIVYAPVRYEEYLSMEKVVKIKIPKIEIGLYRSYNPLKNLFIKPKENVCEDDFIAEKTIIIGAKNCDLVSLELLDKVFIGKKFVDPYYKARRENTLIIGVDCSDCLPVCFCSSVGVNPYPSDNCDISFSHYDEDSYIVTYSNSKGNEFLKENNDFFSEVDDIGKTDEVRKHVENKVKTNNEKYKNLDKNISHIKDFYNSKVWKDNGKKCVGCAACTFICPTCHCYILEEHSTKEQFKKIRQWDSCILGGYARVAGGETPREKMADRLRNRYMCKFDFLERYFDLKGCVGCGRCISAEVGGIDMREILSDLDKSEDNNG